MFTREMINERYQTSFNGEEILRLGVAVALIYMPSLLTEAGSSAFEEGEIQGAEGSYSNLGGE